MAGDGEPAAGVLLAAEVGSVVLTWGQADHGRNRVGEDRSLGDRSQAEWVTRGHLVPYRNREVEGVGREQGT